MNIRPVLVSSNDIVVCYVGVNQRDQASVNALVNEHCAAFKYSPSYSFQVDRRSSRYLLLTGRLSLEDGRYYDRYVCCIVAFMSDSHYRALRYSSQYRISIPNLSSSPHNSQLMKIQHHFISRPPPMYPQCKFKRCSKVNLRRGGVCGASSSRTT